MKQEGIMKNYEFSYNEAHHNEELIMNSKRKKEKTSRPEMEEIFNAC